MAKPEVERRRSTRFAKESSVTVRQETGEERKCATRDVSTGGLFFYCDTEIHQGSRIDVTMILPTEITGGETQWLCCQAKVVRVEKPSAGGQYGIAAHVERLNFLPERKA